MARGEACTKMRIVVVFDWERWVWIVMGGVWRTDRVETLLQHLGEST